MKNIFKKLTALVLAALLAALTLSPIGAVTTYDDVAEGKWYTAAVRYVSRNGLMTGTAEGIFSPGVEFTRAMTVQVLSQLSGDDLSAYTETDFADVPAGKWYTTAVAWAADKGVAAGDGANFNPYASVTREQLAQMIFQFAQLKGIENTEAQGPETADGFADAASIHSWAKDGVDWAVHNGLISGTGENILTPRGTATRAQAAQIFCNLLLMKETGCIPNTDDADAIVIRESETDRIVCWGDSLTAGYNATNSYPEELEKLSGVTTVNYGVSGDRGEDIASRQGALPNYVYPMTIPADTTPIDVELVFGNGDGSSMGFRGMNGVNEITIGGVKGELSYDGTLFYFTRSEAGEEVEITEFTQVVTEGMTNRTNKDIQVYFIGSNNHPRVNTLDEIIEYQQKMIAYGDTDEYIIIGFTAPTIMPELIEMNEILADIYGDKFVDASAYFRSEQVFIDAGIEPTAQDLKDIQENQIPVSFRAFESNGEQDDLHGNELFNELLAKLVYEKILELGYLD